MSKKSEEVIGAAAEATQQPSPYDDLLKNGTAILEAPTHDKLIELVENIPADCKYSVGAVGRTRDGSAYTIQVDLTT